MIFLSYYYFIIVIIELLLLFFYSYLCNMLFLFAELGLRQLLTFRQGTTTTRQCMKVVYTTCIGGKSWTLPVHLRPGVGLWWRTAADGQDQHGRYECLAGRRSRPPDRLRLQGYRQPRPEPG